MSLQAPEVGRYRKAQGSTEMEEQTTFRHITLTGPVLLITIGVIFLLNEFVPGWTVTRTWPALLIVFGILKLVDSARPPRPPRGPRI